MSYIIAQVLKKSRGYFEFEVALDFFWHAGNLKHMTLKDYMLFVMLLAFGNMLRKHDEEQRKYAWRMVKVCNQLCKNIPEGAMIWQVLLMGAASCANGDMCNTIRISLVVLQMKNELLGEAARRKKVAVAEAN
jgi:hypothetical protein